MIKYTLCLTYHSPLSIHPKSRKITEFARNLQKSTYIEELIILSITRKIAIFAPQRVET